MPRKVKRKKKGFKRAYLLTCDTSTFVRLVNGGKYTSEDFQKISALKN